MSNIMTSYNESLAERMRLEGEVKELKKKIKKLEKERDERVKK